jgi:predicted esterase
MTPGKLALGVGGAAVVVGVLAYVLLQGSPRAGEPALTAAAPGPLIDLPGGLKAAPRLQVADDVPAPLLIVLHGREGTEKQLVPFVPLDLRARVFFLRGNIPGPKMMNRWSFFAPRYKDPEVELVAAMAPAIETLRAALLQLRARYPTTGALVLGGSQGGHLAYALAAQGDVDGAVAVSGALPPPLRPLGAGSAGVIGIHGTADTTVPAAAGKATVGAFKAAGYPLVEWIPIAKGTHALTQARPEAHKALHKLAAMMT